VSLLTMVLVDFHSAEQIDAHHLRRTFADNDSELRSSIARFFARLSLRVVYVVGLQCRDTMS
jgi:hypothetical protein